MTPCWHMPILAPLLLNCPPDRLFVAQYETAGVLALRGDGGAAQGPEAGARPARAGEGEVPECRSAISQGRSGSMSTADALDREPRAAQVTDQPRLALVRSRTIRGSARVLRVRAGRPRERLRASRELPASAGS